MRVEECCQAILWDVLPSADRARKGICIDVGVGNFAFYCDLFSRRGFQCVAVEPLPVEALRKVCRLREIRLLEYCLSDYSGLQELYLGTYDGQNDMNLSSLLPDWWGASKITRQVRSVTLRELLSMINAVEVTCLKLDVEGMEHRIISQLSSLAPFLLPKVFMFEYGGGSQRAIGEGGWAGQFLRAYVDSINLLKELGYQTAVVIDSAPNTTERLLDLGKTDIEPEMLFHSRAIYGNIIAFRGFQPVGKKLIHICRDYYDNASRLTESAFFRRIPTERIRRFLYMSRSK